MILSAQSLYKKYKHRMVVNSISIKVEQGEIVGLLGPNGAGKTTTFYMTVGLIEPYDGNVYLDKKDITKAPMYERARAGIGYLPQESSIFRGLTVEDNLMAIAQMLPISKKQRKEKVDALFTLISFLVSFLTSHAQKQNVSDKVIRNKTNFFIFNSP